LNTAGEPRFNRITDPGSTPEVEMPCIDFPIQEDRVLSLRHSDPERDFLVIAEKDPRVDRRRVRIEVRNAVRAEFDQIMLVYDDGLGMCRHFLWQAPGDDEVRKWLFAEPVTYVQHSANRWDITFTIADAE